MTARATAEAEPSTLLVQWSDELSVGIQEIDEQHRVLVNLLNQLNDAIQHHHGSVAAQAILGELVDYTKIHFAVEESLMRILGYPGYDDHKALHDQLIDEVKELQEKLATGKKSISFELLHFLKMWLTKHIMDEDQQYGPYFLNKGAVATFNKPSWGSRFWHSLFG